MNDQNITRQLLKSDGLVGELVVPSHQRQVPAVLCIGGSSGGVGNSVADRLAQAGFAAFSLGYFGAAGLPSSLANIPMEYFIDAVSWLTNHSSVKGQRIGVIGSSRGSEAALELATLNHKVGAVAVYVPSGVRWNGVDGLPPWTYKGNPLPFVDRLTQYAHFNQDGSVAKVDMYNKVLDNSASYVNAEIEIEKAQCPILLISGKDDQLWPSERMAAMITRRLEKHQYEQAYNHISYENAGHRIKVPGLDESSYVPVSEDTVTHELLSLGGTLEGNRVASEKSWEKTLKFFRGALESSD